MHVLFEVQLHSTDTSGTTVPIEITLRPYPQEVNYAWPSSFGVCLFKFVIYFLIHLGRGFGTA